MSAKVAQLEATTHKSIVIDPVHAYDDAGRGLAVILLHGFPFNRSMWRAQAEFLAPLGYRIVAPDLRGLGSAVRTSACDSDQTLSTTMGQMAGDVDKLMNQLDIGRAVVCGLSMGGYVALDFVSRFRERVAALILAGARAAPADEPEKQSRERNAQRVLDEGFAPVVDSITESLLAPRTLVRRPDVVEQVRRMILDTDPRGAAAAQRGMAERPDYSQGLSAIAVPALIIAGREDPMRTPQDAEFLFKRIPNSRLEVIAEAGHLMNMEQSEAFNESVLSFLRAALSSNQI